MKLLNNQLNGCVYERRGPSSNVLVNETSEGVELTISPCTLTLLDSWRRERIVVDNSSDSYLTPLKRQATKIVDLRGSAPSMDMS